jgi:archaellum component FlaG (FlaF/FlaG flagellin family)
MPQDKSLNRDLFVFNSSEQNKADITKIKPSTILDQVYDPLSPTLRTLRDILDEMRLHIKNGGVAQIPFPVTNVNGMIGAVKITPMTLGLERVDNTRDIDKLLSLPQRKTIEEMLTTHQFEFKNDILLTHVKNFDNPHAVNVKQLNRDGELMNFVQEYIAIHNASTHHSTHPDLRQRLGELWTKHDDAFFDFNKRLTISDDNWRTHIVADFAHRELFARHELLKNKVDVVNPDGDNNSVLYPSVQGLLDYITEHGENVFGRVITKLKIISSINELPEAERGIINTAFFIKKVGNQTALAQCILHGTEYEWDVKSLGSYSDFNPDQFILDHGPVTIKDEYLVSRIIPVVNKAALLRSIEMESCPNDAGTLFYWVNGDDSNKHRVKLNTSIADSTHRGNPDSHTGLIFFYTEMKAGNEEMRNPRGVNNIIGNTGNGFARIKRVA